MKRVLIVQSIPEWTVILGNVILREFPKLLTNMNFTTTFDQAIDLANVFKDDDLIIITSDMFHDEINNTGTITKKIPENEKDGNRLAQMIKVINPKAKVYLYSSYHPREEESLDGIITKSESGDMNTLLILEEIRKFFC